MITAETVIEKAREWRGVKFLHQGRTRDGADCIGFIAALAAELGSDTLLKNLPKNYARAPQALLIDGLTRLSEPMILAPGALILIQLPNTKYPSHAAIFTGVSMIHSNSKLGKVVEHSYGNPWLKLTDSIWRMPQVTY